MAARRDDADVASAAVSGALEGLDQASFGSMEPITVRIPDAIKLTGIGRSKLYELISSGDIETIKVGRMTLIPVDGLRTFIRRRTADKDGRV